MLYVLYQEILDLLDYCINGGRKDPFVSTSEFGMNTKSVLYNQDGVVKESSQKSDNSKGTIEYAIKNPMTYIVDGNSKSNTSQLPYQYAYMDAICR